MRHKKTSIHLLMNRRKMGRSRPGRRHPTGVNIKPETLALLRKVSSPTLCTQLFKRGFRNVYLQGKVAQDAAEQEVMEVFILERVRDGAALPGTYPPNAQTRAAFEVWRKARGV